MAAGAPYDLTALSRRLRSHGARIYNVEIGGGAAAVRFGGDSGVKAERAKALGDRLAFVLIHLAAERDDARARQLLFRHMDRPRPFEFDFRDYILTQRASLVNTRFDGRARHYLSGEA